MPNANKTCLPIWRGWLARHHSEAQIRRAHANVGLLNLMIRSPVCLLLADRASSRPRGFSVALARPGCRVRSTPPAVRLIYASAVFQPLHGYG